MLFSSISIEDQLFQLRSISKGKPKDSKFITMLLDFLYGENMENMCVREKKGHSKIGIPDSTLTMIGEMLSERVNSEDIPPQTVLMRCDRLIRLIGDGIYNNKRKIRMARESFALQQASGEATAITTADENDEKKPNFEQLSFSSQAIPEMMPPNYDTIFIPPTYNQDSYYVPYYYSPYSYPYAYNQGQFSPQ